MGTERTVGKGRNGSVFSHVEEAAPDAVFNVAALFREDKHPKKVNLSVGGAIKIITQLPRVPTSRSRVARMCVHSLQERGGSTMGAASGAHGGGADEHGPHVRPRVSTARWDEGLH